jgi:hypothetical protein
MPHNERKPVFLRNLISVFKIAAWAIPGSDRRAAFEESLNPLFKSMEQTEAAWENISESMNISLFFTSPGIANSQGNIVLGTVGFGVCCISPGHIHNISPNIILPAKVLLEANLQHIFGIREEQKPSMLSSQNVGSQNGDGRDQN